MSLKVTFAVWNLCNTQLINKACFNYSVFTHQLESAHGLWFKRQNIKSKVKEFSRSQAVTYTSKVVLSRKLCYIDIVTTGHEQEVIYSLFSSRNCDNLGCMSRSFVDCKLFQMGSFIVQDSILRSALHGHSALAEFLVIVICKFFCDIFNLRSQSFVFSAVLYL